MGKVVKVNYCTPERKAKVNPDNIKLYEKYLKSNIIKNPLAKESTYKVYQNYFMQFLVYLSEEWDNVGLYSEEFMENAVDVLEGFMAFCQETLKNNKKIINTKISAVSSFYLWSMKRKSIPFHPFDKRIDRMKQANKEKIISTYFLTQEQVDEITKGLIENKDNKYDFMDLLIWKIMLDSANRIGAMARLTLSSLDLEEMCFKDIREKEFYIVDVSFEEDTKELIEQWLEMRKEMDNLEIDAMWVCKYHGEWKQMTKGTLQERIKKIGRIIGLEDFRSHCVRKTASNLLLDYGVDASLVAKKLNHKDVSTTLTFYQKEKSSTEIRSEIKKQLAELKNKRNN
jgi:integrase/recombinase XerC